jgi:hypothetical protein
MRPTETKTNQIKLRINMSDEIECEKKRKAFYSINQSLKNKIIQKEYQAKKKTIIEKIINQPHKIQRKIISICDESN